MNSKKEFFHEHREHSPARQVVFQVLGYILKRFESILRKNIDNTLDVERYNMTIADLPEHLAGTKIVHISDMHFHENWEPGNMKDALIEKLRVVKEEAQGKEVVLVFSGDFLSKTTNVRRVVPEIKEFTARISSLFGSSEVIYACEGNHDTHHVSWGEEKEFLEDQGISYTGNWNHNGIHIVSTPDFTVDPDGAASSFEQALTSETPNTHLRIILSHNLEVLSGMDVGVSAIPQIIMGGHTHNGHIGLIDDRSWSDGDPVRRLMARILLGYGYPLIAGARQIAPNIFAAVSPGVGENIERPRFNSPRGLLVTTLEQKKK